MNVISEQIGHILIIRSKGNLKDLKRFAEEQLSKKKYIRTVLLQTNKVSNEERVPSLRYFMGEKNLIQFIENMVANFISIRQKYSSPLG